ncbi:MAG: hypothetical protein AVDCRST_MAG88-3122, partial [uncultured Thermomicrobiales bacterium]
WPPVAARAAAAAPQRVITTGSCVCLRRQGRETLGRPCRAWVPSGH